MINSLLYTFYVFPICSCITWTKKCMVNMLIFSVSIFHPPNNTNHSFPGDSLISYHNGRKFATPDKDNNNGCVARWLGSWWYAGCFDAKLTGNYIKPGHFIYAKGIHWTTWLGFKTSLKGAEMKLKQRGKGRPYQLLASIYTILI